MGNKKHEENAGYGESEATSGTEASLASHLFGRKGVPLLDGRRWLLIQAYSTILMAVSPAICG